MSYEDEWLVELMDDGRSKIEAAKLTADYFALPWDDDVARVLLSADDPEEMVHFCAAIVHTRIQLLAADADTDTARRMVDSALGETA